MKKSLLGLVVCSLILMIVYRFPVVRGNMRYSMEIIYRIAIAVILVGVTWQFNRYMAAFLGLALFSQFYPVLGHASARAFYNVVCGVVLYVILVQYGKDWSVHLLNMLCVVALLHTFFIILQVVEIRLLWQNSGGTITGIMENQNSSAALAALCLPAFLRRKWHWFSILILFALFASKSSGGMIAALIGLSFYTTVIVKDKRYLFPIGMGIVIIGAIFVIFFDMYQSFDIRLSAWSKAIELYPQHWLTGCGLGRWKNEFAALVFANHLSPEVIAKNFHPVFMADTFPQGFIRLHSSLFQTLIEMGIGFAVILGGYLLNIGKRSWGNLAQLAIPLTALIIILANGSINFLIRIAPNATIVIIWLAIMEIELCRVAKLRDT